MKPYESGWGTYTGKYRTKFRKTDCHPACDGHEPAPQKFIGLVRVCKKCGRQYEPATGITYQK